jgi:hypothetical protein
VFQQAKEMWVLKLLVVQRVKFPQVGSLVKSQVEFRLVIPQVEELARWFPQVG